MRASSHDRVARILHVFVLHAPCEVAAPHDSDAFDMQVHERMSTIPRGQLCLLLGDFNARVGSIAADCFGGHAPVTLRIAWSHSTLSSLEIPTLGRQYLENLPDWTTFVPAPNSSLPPGGLSTYGHLIWCIRPTSVKRLRAAAAWTIGRYRAGMCTTIRKSLIKRVERAWRLFFRRFE